MNIRDELENYQIYKFNLEKANIDKEELDSEYIIYTHMPGLVQVLSDMPKAIMSNGSPVEKYMDNEIRDNTCRYEKYAKVEKEIMKYENKIRILDGLINTLSEYEHRIITKKYICRRKMIDIATEEIREVSAIKKTIKSAIGKMQSIYNKSKKN